MKEKITKILRWFYKIWVFLVVLSVFVGAIGILISDGWGKFIEVFSPFNVVNFLVIFILLLPAIGAYYLSERLEKTQLENTKKCNICGQEKPEKDFYKPPEFAQGIKFYICKECMMKKSIENAIRNKNS